MSQITATVEQIEECDSLHVVTFDIQGERLSMISLELGENIAVGTRVKVAVKPTHIAIGKNFSGDISYSNQLKTTIVSIENGRLLSSIRLQFSDTILESIITLKSAKRMNLQKGDQVVAIIKASALSISEVYSD